MMFTYAQVRLLVFTCSVAYADALAAGKSVQEAEWVRAAQLAATIRDIG